MRKCVCKVITLPFCSALISAPPWEKIKEDKSGPALDEFTVRAEGSRGDAVADSGPTLRSCRQAWGESWHPVLCGLGRRSGRCPQGVAG